MTHRTSEKTLHIVAAIGVAAAVVLLVATSPLVRAIVGLPLVLWLPGYAITAALFPRRALDVPERVAFSVGLSLAVVALGGLALNWTPWGLRAETWAVLLGATTCLAGLIALARRKPGPLTLPRLAHLGLNGRQAVWIGLAAIVVAVALGLAHTPSPQQNAQGYAVLWILPFDAGAPTVVRLGVDSMEPVSTRYRLEVKVDGRVVREWSSIALAPAEKWEESVDLSAEAIGAQTVEAALYRLDDPRSVYRRVALRLGASN